MKRLTELEPHEVSIVNKGANKKKWLVLKRHPKSKVAKISREELQKIVDCEPDTMQKVDDVIKAHNQKFDKGLNTGFSDEESEISEGIEKDKLSAEGRKHVKPSNFVFPKDKRYPIHDLAHARNALARSSGKPEESKVRAAVYRRYPELKERAEKAYEELDVVPACEQRDAEYPAAGTGASDHDEKDFNEPFNDQDISAIVKEMEGTQKAEVSQDQDEQQGPLDEQAQASLKAVVRILSPQKGKLSPMLIHQVLDAAGFELAKPDGGDGMAMKEASDRQSPEPIKEEHKIEAMKVAKAAANKAYGEHLQKLGYRKYPDAEMAQKAVNTDPDEPAQEEEQEGTEHNPDASEEGKTTMHKKVAKSLDVSKQTKEVQLIYKQHQELVEKSERQEKELTALRRTLQRREFVAKAEGLKHLGVPTEELATTLMDLSEAAPKQYEAVEKIFKSLESQNRSADLFGEIGSNLPDNTKTTWDKIEQAAVAQVAKSGEKISPEAAVERFLGTSEGKRMYQSYMNDHASSGRR